MVVYGLRLRFTAVLLAATLAFIAAILYYLPGLLQQIEAMLPF